MMLNLLGSLAYADTDNNLPDLGDPNASYLSDTEERKYANEFLKGLYHQFTVIDDPLVDSYIHDLGFRLVGSTNYSRGLHFAFFTILTPVINAMAGPNGNIAIATGLILATHNEAELAGVMAHEIAHVTQHHFAASVAYSKKMTPAIIALMLAGLAATAQNAEVGNSVVVATAAGSAANTLRIQRTHEQAADRIGLQILQKAGFNPRGMTDFFLKLQENVRYYGDGPGFLSDHPLTTDRIADLTNRAASYPAMSSQINLRYALIRERIRVMSASPSKKIVNYYMNKLKNHNDSVNKKSLTYGYALTLIEGKQFTQGEQKLRDLLQSDSDNPIYIVSLAEAYIENHQIQSAITLLENALTLNPDNYPMVLTYAIALEKAKRYTQVIRYLNEQIYQLPAYPLFYNILAKAQAANHQLANAYQSQVKALLMQGNKTAALRQLRIAMQLPKLSEYQRLAIEAQIRALTAKE